MKQNDEELEEIKHYNFNFKIHDDETEKIFRATIDFIDAEQQFYIIAWVGDDGIATGTAYRIKSVNRQVDSGNWIIVKE